jgi:hypothetical protein
MSGIRAFLERARDVHTQETPLVSFELLLRKITFDTLNVYGFVEAPTSNSLCLPLCARCVPA